MVMQRISQKTLKDTKLLHPAILDGRTWSKLGEHREHGEHGGHGKDGKHQPDDLRYSIYDSKHSIYDSRHAFCQPDPSKHANIRHL